VGKIKLPDRRECWADINHLNLLTEKRFLSLFPEGTMVEIYRQRIFEIAGILIAATEK